MTLKIYKPTSPGRRGFIGVKYDDITKDKPEKALLKVNKRQAGRNNQGKLTVRHRGGGSKKMVRVIDFKRDKFGVPGRVDAIEYDPNRSARLALIFYADGDKRYILAPNGLSVGEVIKSGPDADYKTGNSMRLGDMPNGTQVHNVELNPGRGGQMVRSAGASWREHKAGSFGIGCFSFYPTKNMTTGEGGMITTNDQDIACKCRLLRNHGQAERYRHTILGYNARMTEIAAVIGLSQLKRLDLFNEVRIKNAGFLTEVITSINGLVPPQVLKGSKHVFHQYTIRVTPNYKMSRDELKNYLEANGIGCGVHYPIPIHQQPMFRDLDYTDELPTSEQAAREVLSLPVHPSLTSHDLNTIAEVLKNA
jgi:hypothetical protein